MTMVVSAIRALAIAQSVGAKEHMCRIKMILLSASLFTALSVTGPQNKKMNANRLRNHPAPRLARKHF